LIRSSEQSRFVHGLDQTSGCCKVAVLTRTPHLQKLELKTRLQIDDRYVNPLELTDVEMVNIDRIKRLIEDEEKDIVVFCSSIFLVNKIQALETDRRYRSALECMNKGLATSLKFILIVYSV